MNYIFDHLDKQIIKRVPYSLSISLIIYLLLDPESILLLLAFLLFALFIFSTAVFNWYINKSLERALVNIDFKRFVEKISNIFEGKASLIDDIKASEDWKIVSAGVLSGASFVLLLTTIFLMFIDHFALAKELVVPIIIVLLIYLYQDIAETDWLIEYQTKESETPFLKDIIEMYMVTNSLKSFPMKSLTKALLRFASRIFGPLCYLAVPNIHSDMVIVYKNREVVSLIKELTKEHHRLFLKHEEGQSIETFFTEGKCEKITVLRERSPKENFPYLFDPVYEYSIKNQKKWTVLSLVEQEKGGEKVHGYVFIHMFKGVYLKTKVKKKGRRLLQQEAQPKEVLFFILVGERKYVHYLKAKIEVISTKYPLNFIDMEYHYS